MGEILKRGTGFWAVDKLVLAYFAFMVDHGRCIDNHAIREGGVGLFTRTRGASMSPDVFTGAAPTGAVRAVERIAGSRPRGLRSVG